MIFWGNVAKIRRLEKELAETKKQLWAERMKVAETAEELQKTEFALWEREKELKELDFRRHCVKDKLRHELWEKISPIFFMEGKKLRTACEQGSVYYKSEIGQWVAVDSYCVLCSDEIEIKKFDQEPDALRYAAIRQMFNIPPQYTTCPKCYQNYLNECA